MYVEERGRVNGKVIRTFSKYLGPRDRFSNLPLNGNKTLSPATLSVETFEFGISATMWSMAQEIDLTEIIDKIIPEKESVHLTMGQYLTLAAINRVADACSKTGLADWFRHDWLSTQVPIEPEILNAQTYWNHFQRLTPEDYHAIELELGARIQTKFGLSWNHLLYDTTNIFSFAQPDDEEGLRHFGHSKENRNGLPLVNVYLVCSKPWGIPILHEAYAGNTQDAEEFKVIPLIITTHMHKLGLKPSQMTLYFDKGNLSPEAFAEIDNAHFKFIASLRNSTQKDLLHVPRSQFTTTVLPGSKKIIEYFQVKRNVYGQERIVYVVIDPAKAVRHQKKFEEILQKKQNTIQTFLSTQLNVKKWRDAIAVGTKLATFIGKRPWKSILIPTITGDYGNLKVTLRVDDTAKHSHEEMLGRSILFTNQSSWTPEEVIWGYREQYIIEHAFKAMKDPNSIAIRPLFHSSEKSIEGHIFTCVLALMLLALVRFKLAQKHIFTSYHEILTQLRHIHISRIRPDPTYGGFFKMDRVSHRGVKFVKLLHLEQISEGIKKM